MATSTAARVSQFGLKAHKPSETRNPPKNNDIKLNRRVRSIREQLVAKIGGLEKPLKYASRDRLNEQFFLWVSHTVIDKTDVIDYRDREELARKAIAQAFAKKELYIFEKDDMQLVVCTKREFERLTEAKNVREAHAARIRSRALHSSSDLRGIAIEVAK